MSALLDYIQKQQDTASQLSVMLDALQSLNLAKIDGKLQSDIIGATCLIAAQLNDALDVVNLPKGGAA